MTPTDLNRFCTVYLAQHPELKVQLDGIADPGQFARLVVEAGAAAGYRIGEAEVIDALRARGVAELSEEQLDAVAGGTEPKKEQQTYLIYRLTDILISG